MTRTIPLTRDKAATVDDEDYAIVARHQWHWTAAGAAATIGGRSVLMHRMILSPHATEDVVFLNSDKADCRRANMTVIDRGYAQWVDRSAYGYDSMLPLINRLDDTNIDVGAEPTDIDDWRRKRTQLIEEIQLIDLIFKDEAIVGHLDWKQRERFRNQLTAVKYGKTKMLRQLKMWSKERTPPPTIVGQPGDKALRHAARYGKWVEYQTELAQKLGLDTRDGLMVAVLVMIVDLERSGRVEYTAAETDLLNLLSDYCKKLEEADRGVAA